MADSTLKVSGYLTTEAAIVFAGTRQLDSLADNEYTDLSNEIDNSTNKYAYVDLRVNLASITPTGTDLKAAAQAQDGVLMGVPLPNGKYKWGVRNRANVALAADAGDIYWRPWGYLGDEA